MLIKLEDGRMKDVALSEITEDNYIVPDNERDIYHVKIENVRFSPRDGRRLSSPYVQKFDAKIWRTLMERHLKQSGYTSTILYDPTDYIKQVEEEERKRKEALNAPKKSEAERKAEFDKAVKEAVAAEIAKLSSNSKGKK